MIEGKLNGQWQQKLGKTLTGCKMLLGSGVTPPQPDQELPPNQDLAEDCAQTRSSHDRMPQLDVASSRGPLRPYLARVGCSDVSMTPIIFFFNHEMSGSFIQNNFKIPNLWLQCVLPPICRINRFAPFTVMGTVNCAKPDSVPQLLVWEGFATYYVRKILGDLFISVSVI